MVHAPTIKGKAGILRVVCVKVLLDRGLPLVVDLRKEMVNTYPI